jgi:Ferritin-like domain
MSQPPASAGTEVLEAQGVQPVLTRADLLVKGALTAAALYGASAVEPHVRKALAAGGGSDVEILNFLLPFEYLQTSLYNRARSETNSKDEEMPLDRSQRQMLETFLSEDGQHVDALREAIRGLGGKPVEKGSYAFAFLDFDMVLQFGGQIETVAVGAYNGAIPSLKSAEARQLAGSIVQVDGRHAAAARIPLNEEPAPEAFDRGLNENSAITLVQQFTGVFPDYE